MSLIDGEPRSATAVAESNCVLLVLTRERLDQLATKAPGLAYKVLLLLARLISQRLRQTSGKFVEFAAGAPTEHPSR